MFTKNYIMQTKVLPYFGNRKITDIKAADIRKWQAELIGSELAGTYIKTINNQISAVFIVQSDITICHITRLQEPVRSEKGEPMK